MTRAFFAIGTVSILLVSGCSPAAPAASPGLMENSTPGQNRCVMTGDDPKLFVVDWDATDASAFQARAERDVVFVHFDNCEMRIVEGCRDASLAGRFGTYRAPTYTSGSLESFSMRTSDDVAAKLPLGFATLGGEVSQGKALELSYFVAGTATATRDVFARADLADNPKCADATHVVWAYGLGAYELASKESSQVAGGAAVAGVGAEASHDREKSALRRAGKLEDCSKVDNFACRVPIRVTLRRIEEGTTPPPAVGTAAPAPGQPDLSGVQASMQAVQYRASAEQKFMAHDGAGCLSDLDLADRADPQGKMGRLELRARCEMRAGRCDEGKAHYAEARRAWHRDNNPTGLASDATVEHEVDQLAMQECPSAGGGGKSGQNRALELTQKVMQASMRKDTNACVEHGNELDRLASQPTTDPTLQRLAAAGLQQAARCAGAGGRCVEAKKFYFTFAKLFMNANDDMAASAFEQNIPSCRGR